jgi:hypothetical protein
MCRLLVDRYHRCPNGGVYEWFDRVGLAVDRAALRSECPDVTFQDFESWAKKKDWSALNV